MNYLTPILLLTISNTFMTVAWYGHLRYPRAALWIAIAASWLIALAEYIFQVPANRFGYTHGLSAGTLKVIQEVITLIVFVIFARLWLNEKLTWNYYVAFALIALAVFFIFYFRPPAAS